MYPFHRDQFSAPPGGVSQATSPARTPIHHIYMLTPVGQSPIDVTPYCVITVTAPAEGGSHRWITVHGCPEHKFMHGRYLITTNTAPEPLLLCDDVAGAVPVEPFEYYINLLLDANKNGIADSQEIAANPSLDVDNDGYIDSTAIEATCIADFNGDGFLDFTDFDAFVLAFELGDASADMNLDGFIDFTDFDDFVSYFEFDCSDPTTSCT